VEAGATNPPSDGRDGSPRIQSVAPGTHTGASEAGRCGGVGRGHGAPAANDAQASRPTARRVSRWSQR